MPFVFSNASALAPAHVRDKATASSIMSFINMFVAVILIFGMGLLHGTPEHIMPEVFGAIVLLQLLLFALMRREESD